MGRFSKQERSWMLYDWGSSAFSVIITTAIFPIYYKAQAASAGIENANSTAYLGYTISIFTFILAILGPILGTIADYQGYKKKIFLKLFRTRCFFSTASLVFVPEGQWIWLLIFYTLASIGSTGANIFYDAFFSRCGG